MEPWSLTACSPRPALIDALRRPCVARARAHACSRRTVTNARVPRGPAGRGRQGATASLEACSKVLDEYLPELKKIDGVTVNRAVRRAKLLRSLDVTRSRFASFCTAGISTSHTKIALTGQNTWRSAAAASTSRSWSRSPSGRGPWEEAGHPPEADFIAKLKAIWREPGRDADVANMVL